jgi:hypothetical protein
MAWGRHFLKAYSLPLLSLSLCVCGPDSPRERKIIEFYVPRPGPSARFSAPTPFFLSICSPHTATKGAAKQPAGLKSFTSKSEFSPRKNRFESRPRLFDSLPVGSESALKFEWRDDSPTTRRSSFGFRVPVHVPDPAGRLGATLARSRVPPAHGLNPWLKAAGDAVQSPLPPLLRLPSLAISWSLQQACSSPPS